MNHVAKTPFDLTLHLVSVGGNSDGGWIPGNGFPNPQIGRVGQRYVDVQTGHIYGPKTRDGWSADSAHTLNLGNVAGEFANMLSRVPKLEGRATNLESRTTNLEGRADSAADLAILQHATIQDHDVRIESLKVDNIEIKRRIGTVDGSLSARMVSAEEAINDLSRLHGTDVSDFNSRLDALSTQLIGTDASLSALQGNITSMSLAWAQDVASLRSSINGNISTLHGHNLRIESLEVDNIEIKRRIGMVDSSLSSRMLSAEDAINDLSRLRGLDLSDFNSRLGTLTTELNSNGSSLTTLQESFTGLTQTWTQEVTTLRSDFNGNISTLTDTLRTQADRFSATATQVTELTARVGTNEASLTTESLTRATQYSALAEQISTLSARTSTSEATLTSQQTTMANDLEAYASSVLALSTEIEAARADFREEIETLVTADSALARRVSTLDVAASSLSGQIENEQTARISADSAVLTSAQNMVAQSESELRTQISQEAAARLSGDEAEAYQRSLMDTKFTNQGQTLNAAISAERTARSNAIAAETQARNQQISTVNTSINNLTNTTDGLGTQITQVSAAITSESQTRANAIAAETTARIQQISALSTNIGTDVSAAITQEATTRATVDGYLGGRYTLNVSTSAGGIATVAGMEIASTSAAGRTTTGHIAFYADRFYITHSNNSASTVPFEVVGGQVYIKSAVIQDAAITNAKIGNLQIDTIKIQDRAITTMATAIAGGSNANSLINGSYSKYGGDWRRIALLSLGCSNGTGSEAIVIWVSIKAMINGYPGYSESGDSSVYVPPQPSGWGISIIRGDGTTVFTTIFPQAGGGSLWWAASTGEDQLISVVDVPPVGYHTYTVVLNGPYSQPDKDTFNFSQLSLTVLNAKK